eukprot:GHUV01000639.1.p1 GENE.GHUV01000639.1~~GHUV01000639.1.p1  ORF type:complete len:701 (+),score=275.00 GHUV01000639.1:70-2172(+)
MWVLLAAAYAADIRSKLWAFSSISWRSKPLLPCSSPAHWVVPAPWLQVPSSEPQDPTTSKRRLFFAQAAQEITEQQLSAWFIQFGTVEQVELYRDLNNSNSGYGYITMATSEQAAAALSAVQQHPQAGCPVQYLNLSCPVTVAVEDPSAPTVDPHTTLVANADRTLFFAKVSPTALASEIEVLFSSFGKLVEVNLFRAWAGAKHSKGCGLVIYADRSAAAAAIAQLHGKYVFPGSDCPMVVEWMDLKKQRPVAPPPVDKPPLGCSHDAYKLALSNIPLAVSEADLVAVLCQFGHVVQIGALTPETTLSATSHVWFASKQSADALLAYVKSKPLWLRDPRTNQELALSVKKARRPGASSGGAAGNRSAATPANNPTISSSSNSSSSLLPMYYGTGVVSDVSSQLAQLQASQRLAAAQAVDMNVLNSDMIRLLPMQQQQQQQQIAAAGLSAGLPQLPSGYMTVDVCEAMLDSMYDDSSIGLSMPVHLQPAMAAQMATNMSWQRVQQRAANSQMCLMPNNMLQQTSGQQCLSSPANIGGLDEFEGSFNMSLAKGLSANMQASQQLAQNRVWQQQQQQPLMQISMPQMSLPQPVQQINQQQMLLANSNTMQMMAAQQQQQHAAAQLRANQAATAGGSGGVKSIAVPIDAAEVGKLAHHLVFFSNQSGAQVTITSLPGAGLAIMITGRPEHITVAQSLLAAARNQ